MIIITAIYKIQPKHLNEHGTLYGGQLLEWIDNYCFAHSEKYRYGADEQFVTRSMDCEFVGPVGLGDIIRLKIKDEKIGNTSITFSYEVMKNDNEIIAKGKAVFVKLSSDGSKLAIKRRY